MSTENKELETAVSPAEPEQETETKKKKLLTANRLEIIVAIFLGITALLTAWATWIGSLHGGIQAINFTKSNNLASEGNAEYNSAMQLYLSDMMTWNTAIDYQLDAEVAKMKGQDAEAQIYQNKTEAYIEQSSSPILKEAMEKMDDSMISPFEVIISMTYILLPVGITSTLDISENLGVEFATTVAHFVSSARAFHRAVLFSMS